ncbi:MAG TPA: hypothetical protein VG962_06685 [Steroidobacteraceae bacterium]|nr:hypothetical protein [Steroidobacteraceae bacterium]
MATTDFVSFVASPATARWGRALHDMGHTAGHEAGEEQSAMQLWKQHHKQGMFNASTRFGFTGMLSRLHNQRRNNR